MPNNHHPKTPSNLIPGPGMTQVPEQPPQVPEYINVNIQIRRDLITHWGGLVINNFSVNQMTNEILAQNVTAPGFTFDTPDKGDEATFLVTTHGEEGDQGEPAKSQTGGTRKKATRKKSNRKKASSKKSR